MSLQVRAWSVGGGVKKYMKEGSKEKVTKNSGGLDQQCDRMSRAVKVTSYIKGWTVRKEKMICNIWLKESWEDTQEARSTKDREATVTVQREF